MEEELATAKADLTTARAELESLQKQLQEVRDSDRSADLEKELIELRQQAAHVRQREKELKQLTLQTQEELQRQQVLSSKLQQGYPWAVSGSDNGTISFNVQSLSATCMLQAEVLSERTLQGYVDDLRNAQRELDGEAKAMEEFQGLNALPRVLEPAPYVQDSSLLPPSSASNMSLSAKQLTARLRHSLPNAGKRGELKAQLRSLAQAYADLRQDNSEEEVMRITGNAAVEFSKIVQTLHFGDKIKRPTIIVTGFEKAGKTTTVNALLGMILGFSDPLKATVAPVEISCSYEDVEQLLCTVELPAYINKDGQQVAASAEQGPYMTVEEARKQMAAFMTAILQTPSGVCHDTVKVTLMGRLPFSGVILDLPGLPKDHTAVGTDLTKQEALLAFQKHIITMTSRALRDSTQDVTLLVVEQAVSDITSASAYKAKLLDLLKEYDPENLQDFQRVLTQTEARGRLLTVVTHVEKFFTDEVGSSSDQLNTAGAVMDMMCERAGQNFFPPARDDRPERVVTWGLNLKGINDAAVVGNIPAGGGTGGADRGTVRELAALNSQALMDTFNKVRDALYATFAKQFPARLPGPQLFQAAMFDFGGLTRKLSELMSESLRAYYTELRRQLNHLVDHMGMLVQRGCPSPLGAASVTTLTDMFKTRWMQVGLGRENIYLPAFNFEPDLKPKLHELFPHALSERTAALPTKGEISLALVLKNYVTLTVHPALEAKLKDTLGQLPEPGNACYSTQMAFSRMSKRLLTRLLCVGFADVKLNGMLRAGAQGDMGRADGVNVPAAGFHSAYLVVKEMYARFVPYAKNVVMDFMRDAVMLVIWDLRKDWLDSTPDVQQLLQFEHPLGAFYRQLMFAVTAMVDEHFRELEDQLSATLCDEHTVRYNAIKACLELQFEKVAAPEPNMAELLSDELLKAVQEPTDAGPFEQMAPPANNMNMAQEVARQMRDKQLLRLTAHHADWAFRLFDMLNKRMNPRLFEGEHSPFANSLSNFVHGCVFRVESKHPRHNFKRTKPRHLDRTYLVDDQDTTKAVETLFKLSDHNDNDFLHDLKALHVSLRECTDALSM